ncbi:MAG: adenylate/guanylate cyclase domain-containing protein [Paracoccaceae bacterium]
MALLTRLMAFLMYFPKELSGEEARFYIFQRIGYFIAASSHAIWAITFWLNANLFLAWYNLAVAIVFSMGGAIALRMRNPFWLMVPLWFIEIPLHAYLGTRATGATTLFWTVPFAAAMAVFLVHQVSWTLRGCIAALMMLATFGVLLMSYYVAPQAQVTFNSQVFLSFVNFVNTICGIVFYIGLNQYQVMVVEEKLKREHDRADGLLKNILPDPIALRLKDGEHLIADDHAEVSVIFADIVNFTEASAKLRPAELVETLNIVFTEFDLLAERHGAEKIKTIGDAYMAVIGVPKDRDNHAIVAIDLALDMLETARGVSAETHFPIDLRIGINSGPVVAGVIGKNKFAYDLWGDAVNVAARMESHSEPGTILITGSTQALVEDRFALTDAGTRDIKGKGRTQVWTVSSQV